MRLWNRKSGMTNQGAGNGIRHPHSYRSSGQRRHRPCPILKMKTVAWITRSLPDSIARRRLPGITISNLTFASARNFTVRSSVGPTKTCTLTSLANPRHVWSGIRTLFDANGQKIHGLRIHSTQVDVETSLANRHRRRHSPAARSFAIWMERTVRTLTNVLNARRCGRPTSSTASKCVKANAGAFNHNTNRRVQFLRSSSHSRTMRRRRIDHTSVLDCSDSQNMAGARFLEKATHVFAFITTGFRGPVYSDEFRPQRR